MNYFVLEDQFQRSLELIGLKKDGVIDVPPHVIHSMRMAFVAGVGVCIDFQANKWKELTTEELALVVIDLGNQIVAFWRQQQINIQANHN